MRRVSRLLLGALCLAVVLTGTGYAQETGEIVGKVTDDSGATLPGATVSVSGPTLLQPLTAQTAETGSYRFPQLPVGEYTLRFELTGFKTVVKEGIRVGIGFTAQVNASLGVSAVEEVVTVSGETPLVDTKETGTATAFSNDKLQSIPSARDPWVMLERTPGITMDRVNVGGSQSGQQSNHISRGANQTNNKWFVDGVDVTDMSATGSTPVYYDFDALEEMQVSTGGNDASQQTGGVGISIVTKSGTDVLRGSGRLYVTDQKFQDDNIGDDLKAQKAGSGAPIQNIRDIGVEAGGPIYRGRAWFWGAYGKQDIKTGVVGFFRNTPGCRPTPPTDTKGIRDCLETDLTVLDNYNIKGQVMPFRGNKATYHSYFADKTRNARDASDLRPIETTLRQFGPVWTHKVGDQHIFSDRWLADVQYAYVGGGFLLDFHEDGQADIQPITDILTQRWERSYQRSDFDRPATSIDATTSYFLPNVIGGDHAFKVGFKWRDTPITSESHWGGNTVARYENGIGKEADLYRDALTNYGLQVYSFYVQDNYTRGRATINLGVRLDSQKDEALASAVGAHPFAPDFLPAISFEGADSGVRWNDWSPRLGLTYDLTGTGRSIVKTSFARYYSQMTPTSTASALNPVTAARVRFPWTDTNGDRTVQRNELNTSNILFSDGNYDPKNPSFLGVLNSVDPNVKNEYTNEFIAGISHQIGNTLAFTANYIWRKYGNFRWDDTLDWTSADYREVANFQATGCPFGPCPAITYFEPLRDRPSIQRRTNRPGYSRGFNGFELVLDKRLSNRWAADVSFAYNDAREYYDSIDGIEDPSNIENLHEAQYAPETTGSGIDNVFINGKWLFKASGTYQLPWDINVAALYNARQGYPFVQVIQSPNRRNTGRVLVNLTPVGETRLDNVHTIDFRVMKAIRLPWGQRFEASFDVFNLANVDTVLARRRTQNAANANDVSGIGVIAPRIARFGLRFVF